MSTPLVRVQAPSNIALIKYMGKSQVASNLPSNASLSFTLNYLRTTVEIYQSSSGNDEWAPLLNSEFENFEMSKRGLEKFLAHVQRVRSLYPCLPTGLKILSGNNFPSDCGLASSASSFAALTEALSQLVKRQTGEEIELSTKVDLSRQGSGSSCRSFFTPWGLWQGTEVRSLNSKYQDLLHAVVVVESGKKLVSSSEAHLRVVTSEQFSGRTDRAEKRLEKLIQAMDEQNWTSMYEIVWAEFWDMHALFETSQPHFSYMLPESLEVLRWLERAWEKDADGPLITMDAGANIHLLYRMDQIEFAGVQLGHFKERFKIFFDPRLRSRLS